VGSPKGGDFNCYNNKLVTLKGCPAKIGGAISRRTFYLNSSQKKLVILISLEVRYILYGNYLEDK
jgi:hypothetical protein